LGSAPYGEPRSPSSRFLPPEPGVEAPYRLTPGLALRVAIVGAVVLVAFGVLLVRLWSLQVLSGDRHLSAAQDNQLRQVRLDAPRGRILDAKGRVIVDNVPGTVVRLWVSDLPPRRRFQIVRRLAGVLNLRPLELARLVDERLHNEPLTPLTVRTAVHEQQIAYLYEHQSEFPGIQIQQTYHRTYPYQSLAAQLLGFTGEISADELRERRKDGDYVLGDEIGKSGVERGYDGFLRGDAGLAEIRVDSLGRPQSSLELRREPVPGSAVRLTIDIRLQRAAERALREGIALARANKSYNANGGAIVAIDPEDGAILAMASNPTFKPSVWSGRLDLTKVAPLLDQAVAKAKNYPALNRVVQVEYPPGSTWKPVTALAALEERLLDPHELIGCPPLAVYGRDERTFKNWDPYVNHAMELQEALARSCDTYFYSVGNRFYEGGETGRARMQEWAVKFGFGQPTSRFLSGEQDGLVPTPAWRRSHFKTSVDRAWNPGDSILLAIGQKDVTATPLQMVRFYAMIANGGKLVTPYIVSRVETPRGKGQSSLVRASFTPDPPRSVDVDPTALQIVRDALYKATHLNLGTSSATFASYPIEIAGKTGTAEKVVKLPGYPPDHLEDQAWWCGWGPAGLGEKPEIVLCVVIENGGHGGATAAPTALRVFEQYFGVKSTAAIGVDTD
jgi:penicillin-binding protein 2